MGAWYIYLHLVDFNGKCRNIPYMDCLGYLMCTWLDGIIFFGFNGFFQEITPLQWWFSRSKSVLVRCQFFLHPKWESTVCVVYMSVCKPM